MKKQIKKVYSFGNGGQINDTALLWLGLDIAVCTDITTVF
jgi:hypothetical protein